MCLNWPHLCCVVHLVWCILYTLIGTIQIVCGVIFLFSVPVLKLGSNIGVGTWNILFGIGGLVVSLVGDWSLCKQRGFLYLAVSTMLINILNLVVLEFGEWHFLLPVIMKKLIQEEEMKTLIFYARTITSVSTIIAIIISFLDSQITFCSMMYHEKYHKKMSVKQDVLSDTEYILPRIKSASDETNDGGEFGDKQPAQSWVYDNSQTAETSTINSAGQNRYSGSSTENIIDNKNAPADAEYKNISISQNVHIEQPVVVIEKLEKTADYTDRQLGYMTSFSRTPSPVPGSDSSSLDSQSRVIPLDGSKVKPTDPATNTYRGRTNSNLSAKKGLKPQDKNSPNTSPRPPSTSGVDDLQKELLKANGNLQEKISQKSYKISSDQIFIPLKDERVIRVKDEVFILPSIKPESIETEVEVEAEPSPQSQSSTSPLPTPELSSLKPETSTQLELNSFKSEESGLHEPEEPTPPVAPLPTPTCEEVDYAPRRPTLPEIVNATRKEAMRAAVLNFAKSPTPDKEERSLTATIMEAIARKSELQTPLQEQKPFLPPSPIPPDDNDDSIAQQDALASSSSSHSQEADPADSEGENTTDSSQTDAYPTLEKQNTLNRQETVIERDCKLPSPMLERQSKIDKQDTVREKNHITPPPLLERSPLLERQSAVFSPREEKHFSPPPVTPPPPPPPTIDEELLEDAESINSTNASTDRESVVEYTNGGDNVVDLIPNVAANDHIADGAYIVPNNYCDGVNGTFHVADEDLGSEVHQNGDREDSELFDLSQGSSQDLPPSEIDIANLPPPQLEDGNGVDGDEWDESEDDDSVDSSCERRVIPSPTKPIND